MSLIERDQHPTGRLGNMAFGVCHLIDGLVRILSFGFLHTTLTLDWAKRDAKRRLEILKKRSGGA